MMPFGHQANEMLRTVKVGNAKLIRLSSSASCIAEYKKQSNIAIKERTSLPFRIGSMSLITWRNVIAPTGFRCLEKLHKLLIGKSRNLCPFPAYCMDTPRAL